MDTNLALGLLALCACSMVFGVVLIVCARKKSEPARSVHLSESDVRFAALRECIRVGQPVVAVMRTDGTYDIKPVRIPLMITRDQHQQLADLGYSKEQRKNMKPEKAYKILLERNGH